MCAPQLLPERPTVLAGLDDPELRATITALGQLGPEVSGSGELWDILLPIIRADIRMCERYLPVPGPPLDCPVIAYGSDDDGDLDERALAAWGEQTTGPFDSRVFEGNHFFFTAQPAAFAADLLHRIAQQVPAAQLTDTPADGGTR
jgi:medium-chain acyl-[acyl-carrier-protein] hydrolase